MNFFNLAMELLFFVNATSNVTLPVINVPAANFNEKYYDHRGISNQATLVGWQSGAPLLKITSATVFVAGIKDTDQTICIEIEHVSGGYSASARIKNPYRGPSIELKLPSTFFAKNKNITQVDLALLVRASSSPRCMSDSAILSAGWEPVINSPSTSMLVNLGLGSVAKVNISNGSLTGCQPVDQIASEANTVRQRFNTICKVSQASPCVSERHFELVVASGDGRDTPLSGTFRTSCPAKR
ncbi:hypothetical protein [Asticcacaulis sp. AC466]|uniref:hypothetical protein n=1 Tax=Asticcacaulis sp. AC466 TaxID=1282362 RepID=UPI0012DE0744|nr:hypothetical protein [Asticcacaulis sp. AC466]